MSDNNFIIGNWPNDLILNAIQSGASDIHFEPTRDAFNIRFRVDGILQEIEKMDKESQENLISRIKILAKMDISDKRIPQDGHYELTTDDKTYNIRVSSLPTVYGESIVMRILNRDDILIKLDKLGLLPQQLELVEKFISGKNGMVLTTGPTGSGKTNLLYSMIRTLNTPERNIITIEDPIEYRMGGIRQTEINEGIGLTFPKVLRSIVRQDPDIIMVGEIRDAETALMAIQSSLIGTLVFSTFHTFDIPALVARLSEFGISRSIIAQSIIGVISTRLIRMICPHCKQEFGTNEIFHTLDDKTKNFLQSGGLQTKYYKGTGCEKCRQTGYLGRTGIFEVIHFDRDIQSAIIAQKSTGAIHDLIGEKNTVSLRDAALKKVISGITTFNEVNRVLGNEM